MSDAQRPSNRIPTEAEFARAHRLDDERHRHLGDVVKDINKRFRRQWPLRPNAPLDYFDLYRDGQADFLAMVFFRTDADCHRYLADGTAREICDAIVERIAFYGLGEQPRVEFEFDSRENVDLNFAGRYFIRTRQSHPRDWARP